MSENVELVRTLWAALDGETIVTVQRTQGRMRHTDIEVDLPWAAVWRVRGGKARSSHGYMSRAQALAAGLT